jgi:hypothetical protein
MLVNSYDPATAPTTPITIKDGTPSGYRPAQRANGGIATNAKNNSKDKTKIKEVIRLENVAIHGGIAKGGGTIAKGPNVTVTGDIIDGFYRELKPVPYPGTRQNPPFFPILPAVVNGVPTVALNAADRPSKAAKSKTSVYSVDLMAGLGTTNGKDPTPLYYKLSNIHLHADKDKNKEVLRIVPNPSGPLPTEANYRPGVAEIWVTGDVVVHKGGQIQVEPGVQALFYVEKNVTLEEKDNDNRAVLNKAVKKATNPSTGITYTVPDPEALQFYGVRSAANKSKKRKFKIKSNVVGLFYAPDNDFEVNLKNDAYRAIWGSLVGRKFKIKGATKVHYDETLADAGKPFDYTLESWQEDWFDPAVRPAATSSTSSAGQGH